jgi:hypothetical protein
VARVVAILFLEDETLVLAEPRIESPSRYDWLILAMTLTVRLVDTVCPKTFAFSREDKADRPALKALAGIEPGERTNIDERPLDWALPFALWVP